MVPNTQTIHVYLLTYNRPHYLLEALNSVLNQNFNNFLVIVSDNSTNDETEKLVQTVSHPKLQYIKRTPSIPALNHFNTVFSEVSSEYFMLFHDDDIMNPDCLSNLSSNLDHFPAAAAVGGNAEIFWDTNPFFKRRFFKPTKRNRVLQHATELAKIYLTFEGLAPFPSYMYRRSLIAGLNLDPDEGGQGSDVAFLLKVLQRGEIVWENRCVMQYRKHHAQDSQSLDIKDLLKVLKYIHQNTDISRKSTESNYFRYKSWASVLKSQFYQTGGKIINTRMKMIYRAVFCFSPFDIFLKLFIWRIHAMITGNRSR